MSSNILNQKVDLNHKKLKIELKNFCFVANDNMKKCVNINLKVDNLINSAFYLFLKFMQKGRCQQHVAFPSGHPSKY